MVRRVNPSWWQTGEWDKLPLRSYLAHHRMGPIFQYLKSRGISYAAIAILTGLGASRISEIAGGKRLVTDYAVLERIAEGLRIPRPYMGLAFDSTFDVYRNEGGSAAGGLDTPTDRQHLLGALASITVGSIPPDINRWLPSLAPVEVPAVVTADDVSTLCTITQVHRRLDAAAGGGACLQSARGYVAWATSLLAADCESDDVAKRLRVALAELHNLVGWVAHDLDQHTMARRHLTQSLVLARQTNALPLMANSLYRLGRVSLHQGEPEEALHLFGLGQHAAQQSGCRASVAILNTNTAWAYALLGVPEQVTDFLARARSELDRVNPDTAPAWTRFALADADHHGISGVVYTALARHEEHRGYADRAVEEAHAAVRLRRSEDRRSFVFDLISVASASVLAGEIGEAAKYGLRAVTLSEGGMRSARVVDRLASMWEIASPHAERNPELAVLGTRLHVLQASA
jgi:transcriptional regulator with XRE-family HTH domain